MKRRVRRSQYQIFPPLPPDRYEALEQSVLAHGIEAATIWDDENNLLDGRERETICAAHGLRCPREVRHFESGAEKFRFILAVNAHRRPNLNQKQKRAVIEAYLLGDHEITDNTLAQSLGVSKNTVLKARRHLETTSKITKVKKTRGKDGKLRPVKYAKRIITNTPNEFMKAQEIISDLPDNCAGKTLDFTTARRRARRARSRIVREAKTANSHPLPDEIKLYHCRFQELEKVVGLQPASVKAIITDIPYEKAWLAQIADLGEFAARYLLPGGLLLMMTGVLHLDDILAEMKRHKELTLIAKLETTWNLNTGTPVPIGKNAMLISSSKPIWLYCKGRFTRTGKFITPIGPFKREKDWHPHQQPLDLFRYLVREWTDPGDLIADPCGGGFTTAVASYLEGRSCISCDTDEECYQRGLVRVQKAIAGEPDCP